MHWWQSLLGESFVTVMFIAASAFIAWLIELSSRQHWNEETGTHKHQAETNEIANEKRTSAGITEEMASAAKPRSDDTEYKETYARANLYLATQIVIATVAAIGIPVAICSLLSLNKSVKAANRQAQSAATQANTAQQEFVMSERPWVSINLGDFGDLRFSSDGSPSITVRWTLKNTGHSPAGYTHIEWKIVPIRFDEVFSAPSPAQKKLCLPLRTHAKPDFDAFTLFPDSSTERQQSVSISAEDVRNQENGATNRDYNRATFFVLGCVDYRFEFETGHHQTGFVYELSKYELRNGVLFDRIDTSPNTVVPRNLLRMEPWPFGDGFYAD
jgi:hypothetical protein